MKSPLHTITLSLPALWSLASCSEYKLEPGDDVGVGVGDTATADEPADDTAEPPAPGAPDILVEPATISITGLCTSTTREIRITNRGTKILTISDISTTDPSWSIDLPELPLILTPGTTKLVEVTGTPGSASLQVTSDDPDEPTVSVSLAATQDEPPLVSIARPTDGQTLGEGADLELQATVSDVEDLASDLSLLWASSQDGGLSSEPADTDGNAVASWTAAGRSPAEHTVSLTATDSCGQATTDAVTVCQQDSATYDEIDLVDWHFEGSARWDTDNDWLELTTPDPYLVGSAFETSVVVTGSEVSIEFLFFVGDGSGADGFSLTALDAERSEGVFLGGTGCGIGFGGNMEACTPGPALPGWSLELDTHYNGEVATIDPTEQNHLAFYFDGNLAEIAAWSEVPTMEDTGWHQMSVVVNAPSITVSIDGTTYIDADLDGFTPFPAWVGFTAGTGGSTNYHLIDALTVTEAACPE